METQYLQTVHVLLLTMRQQIFLQDKPATDSSNQMADVLNLDNDYSANGSSDFLTSEKDESVGEKTPRSSTEEGATARRPPRPGRKEEGKTDYRGAIITEHSLTIEPYGVPCMVEIFSFLCSLLNIIDPQSPGQAVLASDEDVPHFALMLINSSIELGGQSFSSHPKLIALVQDELFRNLMLMGLSHNPLVLSMVCGIVLNLYHHLRSAIKLQLEAFFSFVVIRLAQGKYGATYQQQEVAMEALVDFCRQSTFMPEMYANFDCDITLSNTFEDLGNLLSKSAFPVNCPLSAMHVLALEGLLAVIHSMASRVDSAAPALTSSSLSGVIVTENQEFVPFWTVKCENYDDPMCWVEFVKHQKYIKRRLMLGADHFNRDAKKGFEFLQGIRLLPEKLDPQSVACFFRYFNF